MATVATEMDTGSTTKEILLWGRMVCRTKIRFAPEFANWVIWCKIFMVWCCQMMQNAVLSLHYLFSIHILCLSTSSFLHRYGIWPVKLIAPEPWKQGLDTQVRTQKTRWVFWAHPPKKPIPKKPTLLL